MGLVASISPSTAIFLPSVGSAIGPLQSLQPIQFSKLRQRNRPLRTCRPILRYRQGLHSTVIRTNPHRCLTSPAIAELRFADDFHGSTAVGAVVWNAAVMAGTQKSPQGSIPRIFHALMGGLMYPAFPFVRPVVGETPSESLRAFIRAKRIFAASRRDFRSIKYIAVLAPSTVKPLWSRIICMIPLQSVLV
jgi:hypothetical protein